MKAEDPLLPQQLVMEDTSKQAKRRLGVIAVVALLVIGVAVAAAFTLKSVAEGMDMECGLMARPTVCSQSRR